MTLLVLLRHGETAWSQEGRIQGRTDVPLCDPGKARLGSLSLPGECGTLRVLSSPLRRCLETASALGVREVQNDERLAEMRWGAWEGRRLQELRAEYGEEMRSNEALGLDFRPPGGESPREVMKRVAGLLEEIAAARMPTLAIAHRGVIRAIFAMATGWDMRGRPPHKLDWNALHVFSLDALGAPSVSRLNVALAERVPAATAR
jgi:broad specificity phosphatase PhoE